MANDIKIGAILEVSTGESVENLTELDGKITTIGESLNKTADSQMELADKIANTSNVVKGALGGFTALNGVIGLLTKSNIGLSDAFAKTQVVLMSILGGVDAFANGITAWARIMPGIVTSFRALNTTMKANVILAVASAVVALVVKIVEWTRESNEAQKAQERLNKIKEQAKESIDNLNKSIEREIKLVKERTGSDLEVLKARKQAIERTIEMNKETQKLNETVQKEEEYNNEAELSRAKKGKATWSALSEIAKVSNENHEETLKNLDEQIALEEELEKIRADKAAHAAYLAKLEERRKAFEDLRKEIHEYTMQLLESNEPTENEKMFNELNDMIQDSLLNLEKLPDGVTPALKKLEPEVQKVTFTLKGYFEHLKESLKFEDWNQGAEAAANQIQDTFNKIGEVYAMDAKNQQDALTVKQKGLSSDSAEYKKLEKEKEKIAKEAFERQKNFDAVTTTIDGLRASVSLLASYSGLGPAGWVVGSTLAAATLSTSIATAAKIKQQVFTGGSSDGSSISAASVQMPEMPIIEHVPERFTGMTADEYRQINAEKPATQVVLVVDDVTQAQNSARVKVKTANPY
jgi:hypothetical protein